MAWWRKTFALWPLTYACGSSYPHTLDYPHARGACMDLPPFQQPLLPTKLACQLDPSIRVYRWLLGRHSSMYRFLLFLQGCWIHCGNTTRLWPWGAPEPSGCGNQQPHLPLSGASAHQSEMDPFCQGVDKLKVDVGMLGSTHLNWDCFYCHSSVMGLYFILAC